MRRCNLVAIVPKGISPFLELLCGPHVDVLTLPLPSLLTLLPSVFRWVLLLVVNESEADMVELTLPLPLLTLLTLLPSVFRWVLLLVVNESEVDVAKLTLPLLTLLTLLTSVFRWVLLLVVNESEVDVAKLIRFLCSFR